MTSLVDGNGLLLVGGHHLSLLLQSADDAVDSVEEILFGDKFLVVAGGDKCGLVANVGNVGPREARSLTCKVVDVEAIVGLQRLKVNHEDGFALGQIGQVDVNLTVEAACTQQGLVEHVGAVGGSQHDDARVGTETIHLGEQGVERILALIVATHGWTLRTGAAHGVDLIDEDDARGFLLGLGKDVAHAAGAHADEHLDEVGAAHGEERHTSLTGYSLRQERLTGSRRTDEQCTLGYLTAQIGVFLWVLEEVDNLLHLLFGALLSSDILEGHAHLVAFLIELGLALADVEHAATATGIAHAAGEEPKEEEEENER